MTRRILIFSDKKDLISLLSITALTLTKLNHQVTFEEVDTEEKFVRRSADENVNMILLDLDLKNVNAIELIKNFRRRCPTSSKKLIAFYKDNEFLKSQAFEAGCDSIMKEDELKVVANNLFSY
jgi:PleD family two-component response regulator